VSASPEQEHPGDDDPGRRVVYVYDGHLDLLGSEVKVGDMMPDFSLTAWRDETPSEIIPEDLLAYGRPILISVCSSVDTPVSNVQSSLLALRVKQYAGRVLGVLVTSDLLFTQTRFIREHQCEELIVGSDYLDRNFGHNWGLLLDEAMVLTRAIFVVYTIASTGIQNQVYTFNAGGTPSATPPGMVGETISFVPEPSTWALGAFALACGGWQLTRRRRALRVKA
jgi:peroxiredoxin